MVGNNNDLYEKFIRLKAYCESEDFKGWDPFDGLNSKVLRSLLPLSHSAVLRLVVIQGFKRCPWNLRPLLSVPKEHNAKGIGLFLQGYCNLYEMVRCHDENFKWIGSECEILERIKYLAELLVEMRSQGYHGSCWGYNFDWQSRRLFLFPAYCPTVVCTNFCATALFSAYEVLGDEKYKDVALNAADFVLKDLHLDEYKGEKMISYSPLQGNDFVSNASLLGSKLLSYCYKYTGNEIYKEVARSSVRACCLGQREDGAWTYSQVPPKLWVDSFHTGYNLDGLVAYQEIIGDNSFQDNIERGFNYYINNFFFEDGSPKYYDNEQYPIDIHCPGELLVVLCNMHRLAEHKQLAEKVIDWTLKNMFDNEGYFYYQLKKSISSKIPYMRWSNAFMFNAISRYLLEVEKSKTNRQ